MAIHLMTTTGTETDVRTALGLAPEDRQTTTPSSETITASVEDLPSKSVQAEPMPEPVAPPEALAESDEDTTSDQTPQEKATQTKGRLQKRIDELVAARYHTQGELDAARRQIAELQAVIRPPAPPPPSAPTVADPPREADFDTYDQYLAALATHAATLAVESRLAAKETQDQETRKQAEQAQRFATLKDRVVAFASDHADYDEVVSNPALPNLPPWVTDELTDPRNTLGPALAYALGKDPARLGQLVAMSPRDALVALGELRAELRSNGTKPPAASPKLPSAPPPPTQVRGSAVVAAQSLEEMAKSITPGDPRTSDWLARRNADLAKRGSR